MAFFAYIGLILMLRIAGSRTLSQLNAFDFIVTVALGSTLATVILNRDIRLAEGLLALGLLIFFQFVVSRLLIEFKPLRSVIKTEPRLLVYKGRYNEDAMRDCRITKHEILQMVRSEGMGNLENVEAVVLESNGRVSVIKTTERNGGSVLQNIK